jgi:hypothetical protein
MMTVTNKIDGELFLKILSVSNDPAEMHWLVASNDSINIQNTFIAGFY